MLSKNETKYIQSLCHKKQRQEERLFLAEGVKLVDELLKTGFPIRKLYAVQEWIEQHPGTGAQLVSHEELTRISAQPSPNQVLAVAEQRERVDEPVFAQQLSIALDGIQDPGNLGTILRIADWFGIRQVIAGVDTVELYNPKVIQGSMGSFTRVKIWYRPLHDILSATNLPVYGPVLNGKNIHEVSPPVEGILLIGNEGKGISADLLPFITQPITITGSGDAESLNAAVATGIIVSHLKKN